MEQRGLRGGVAAVRFPPSSGFDDLRRLVAASPAFGVYLLALALLPFRWLSPLGSLQDHGSWTDVLIGVAAALWLSEQLHQRALERALRVWQIPLVLYLVFAAISAHLRLPYRGGSWSTVLLMVELAVLAVITADFASDGARLRMIARVIVASSLATVILAAIGVILFYAGAASGLVGGYGALAPSNLYTRVQGGFESPQLLGSYCIFASGIAASEGAGLSNRLRVATQISLGLVCAATASRALIGYLLAVLLRYAARLRQPWREVLAITTAVACVAAVALLSVGQLQGNPAKPTSLTYVVPAPHDRREDFTSSLATFEQHPLFGIGPGALPGVDDGLPHRAHFTPLNVAATVGSFALVALISMVWLIWRSRRRPTDVPLWSAAAGVGLDGLAQDIDHFRHVWILLGLLAARRTRRDEGGQASRFVGRRTRPRPLAPDR